jgi:hypothetical protein
MPFINPATCPAPVGAGTVKKMIPVFLAVFSLLLPLMAIGAPSPHMLTKQGLKLEMEWDQANLKLKKILHFPNFVLDEPFLGKEPELIFLTLDEKKKTLFRKVWGEIGGARLSRPSIEHLQIIVPLSSETAWLQIWDAKNKKKRLLEIDLKPYLMH